MLVALFFDPGGHHALVGAQPVGEGEVAGGADLGLLKVEAIDGEEVGVEIRQIIEDPDELLDPVADRLSPSRLCG
ncbi:hypothetical protein [Streptomyces mirabilis]|uniref:hypothetical protein n=1 Tax=Streptomyces mirabilis TaxID=68239 RepID=UPI003662E4A6